MRRADRLFELIQILRDGRLHRAQDLARQLAISQRTVYRDMETLMASGVPVKGERGTGYMMTENVTLPPLNLTMDELEALHLGVAVLTEATDPELRGSARALAAKIDAVLPENSVAPETGFGFAIHPFADAAAGFKHMPEMRRAIRARNKIFVTYQNLTGDTETTTIWPLQLEYWGRVWTCSAWCETRNDFRVLRVDRIRELRVLSAVFSDEPGEPILSGQS